MPSKIDPNLIIFESRPDYSDNPRGLYEYVVAETGLHPVWLVHEESSLDSLASRGVEAYLIDSEEASAIVDSAQYLVTASFEFARNKKREQVHVSAWHGFPLKLIGFFESAEGLNASFDELRVITTQTDLMIATSKLAQLLLSGSWAMDPRKVVVTGYPRNDIMLKADGRNNLITVLGDETSEIEDSKFLFYLPTMRQGLKEEGEQFTDNIFNYVDYDPLAIDAVLEENNAYIVAKLHFADIEHYKNSSFELPKRLIFIDDQDLSSKGMTIYHVMSAFDALITDYSSVFADYLLLNKPIIFSIPDVERYAEERGFTVDDPESLMPGAIVKSQEQLISALCAVFAGEDLTTEKRAYVNSLLNTYNDSCSSKRVYDAMTDVEAIQNDSAKDMGSLFVGADAPLGQYMDSEVAKIYFDNGEGFNEGQMVKERYATQSGEMILINCDIPSGTKMIRFDPDDFARIALRGLKVTLDDKDVSYEAPGAAVKDDLLVYLEEDPKLFIDVSDKQGTRLCISFTPIDLLSESNSVIVGLIDDYNELFKEHVGISTQLFESNSRVEYLSVKLDDMENSTSWKVTKPLRNISAAIKK